MIRRTVAAGIAVLSSLSLVACSNGQEAQETANDLANSASTVATSLSSDTEDLVSSATSVVSEATEAVESQASEVTSSAKSVTESAPTEESGPVTVPEDKVQEAMAQKPDQQPSEGKEWALTGPFASTEICEGDTKLQPIAASDCFELSDGYTYYWFVRQVAPQSSPASAQPVEGNVEQAPEQNVAK